MPERDYSKGQIYTIRCRDDPTLIYVGSTINTLPKRLGKHKTTSKQKPDILLYKTIAGNWDRYYIELYELCPCGTKNELERREGEITREIGTLNYVIAGRTRKEYRQDNKEKLAEVYRQYHQANKDTLAEKHRQYNQANKETLAEKRRQYCSKNAELIKEKQHQYYQENKSKLIDNVRQYQQENKEKKAEYNRQFKQKNREKINEKERQKYALKKQAQTQAK